MFHCLVIKVLCCHLSDSLFIVSYSQLFVKNFFNFFKTFYLRSFETEKEGFEPSRRYYRPTPFPGEPLRPAWVLLQIALHNCFFRSVLPEAFYIISCRFLFVKNFLTFLQVFILDKRREWDSNPRALADKRFSRPPRYDHFDISPYIFLCFLRFSVSARHILSSNVSPVNT